MSTLGFSWLVVKLPPLLHVNCCMGTIITVMDKFKMKDLSRTSAAGIVLYHPDVSSVKRVVGSVLRQVSFVLLVDNTPGCDLSQDFKGLQGVEYLANRDNLGIAKALNQLMSRASELGFEWLLTLDQDSIFPEEGIGLYEKVISEHEEPIAIACPVFIDRKTQSKYGEEGFVECCITSGALTSVSAWFEVGGFNEWFFIDLVDFEFCARLRKAGYFIYQSNSVVLSHQIGNPKRIRLFGRTFSSSNHPPMRYYYQARNCLVFEYLYGLETTNPSPRGLVIKAVIVDDDKFKKLKAIIQGCIDAKKAIKLMKKSASSHLASKHFDAETG